MPEKSIAKLFDMVVDIRERIARIETKQDVQCESIAMLNNKQDKLTEYVNHRMTLYETRFDAVENKIDTSRVELGIYKKAALWILAGVLTGSLGLMFNYIASIL